jgi:hypothetical protein
LLESKTFMQRLDAYYYLDPKSPFFRRRFTTLPYLPVAAKVVR